MDPAQLVSIRIEPRAAEIIQRGLRSVLEQARFQPDVPAHEKMLVAGTLLRSALPPADIILLERFGQGTDWPILLVDGLPAQALLPVTPHRGFNVDQSNVAFSDMRLLGLYQVAGNHPVVLSFESYGKLFRNVAPNPDEQGKRISQGYDAELGWHTDNPCGPFEVRPHDVERGNRPHIPRFLGFEALRNRDRFEQPVATSFCSIDEALSHLSEETITELARPRFGIKPPRSNQIAPWSTSRLSSGTELKSSCDFHEEQVLTPMQLSVNRPPLPNWHGRFFNNVSKDHVMPAQSGWSAS